MRKYPVLSDDQVDALALDDAEALATALLDALREQWERAVLDAVGHGRRACFRMLATSSDALAVMTEDGQTLQHLAARFGHVDILRDLITRGVDLNARTQTGLTPLMMAAGGGREEAVHMLLGAGADRHLASASGATARGIALTNGRTPVVQLLDEVATT